MSRYLTGHALDVIEIVDDHLDRKCSQPYIDQPLAQTWARVAKTAEEAGEAVRTLIGMTGQNPRKGVVNTPAELMAELGDTACAAIFAIQHLTKDASRTAAVLDAALSKAYRRVAEAGEAP